MSYQVNMECCMGEGQINLFVILIFVMYLWRYYPFMHYQFVLWISNTIVFMDDVILITYGIDVISIDSVYTFLHALVVKWC